MKPLSNRITAVLAFLLALLAGLPAGPALAETPLRLVFPYSAGGAADSVLRLLAEQMAKSLARPVIVENRTGAGGRIGAQFVRDAAPDGSTLLFAAFAQFTLSPHTTLDLGYDPFADFAPVGRVLGFDLVFAISPDVPAKSLDELAAWVKAHPDRATIGSLGEGSATHLAGLAFTRSRGLDMAHVAYRGTPAALPDLKTGRLTLFVANIAELLAQHRAGAVRIVATDGATRSPYLPDVATLKEAGVDFQGNGWFGLYAPAKTPPAIVERLERAVSSATSTPEFKARLAEIGFRSVPSSSEELARVQRSQSEFWKSFVRSAGIKPE